MIIEVVAPSPGESISEVEIGTWLIEDGEQVEKDQEIAEIESDKATLPLVAEDTGKIKILVNTGETITVGTILCTIDTGARGKVRKQTATVSPEPVPEKKSRQVKPVEEKEVAKTAKSDISKVKISPVAQKMMDEHNLSVDDIISGLKRIGSRVVFVEPQFNPKIAEAVARECNEEIVFLDPIGGQQGRETYVDLMRYNISAMERVMK